MKILKIGILKILNIVCNFSTEYKTPTQQSKWNYSSSKLGFKNRGAFCEHNFPPNYGKKFLTWSYFQGIGKRTWGRGPTSTAGNVQGRRPKLGYRSLGQFLTLYSGWVSFTWCFITEKSVPPRSTAPRSIQVRGPKLGHRSLGISWSRNQEILHEWTL